MAMKLRRVAGVTTLILSALLGFAIWVMLVVLSTRPSLKAVVDLSPQARFTVTEATLDLLRSLRDSGKKLEIFTVYEPLGLPDNATERDSHIYTLRLSLQDLTTDLLRQYAAVGGEAVRVTHYDLRREIKSVRELVRATSTGRQNFLVVKVDQRSKVLSIDFDLAEIDMPGAAGGQRLPGQTRDAKPILKNYKGEEAISSAIKSLLAEGTPKLYVLEGYRAASIRDRSASSYSELMVALEEEGFKIAQLNLTDTRTVPDDAACVALFEPRAELPDQHVEALVEYLRRGGRVFVNIAYSEIESWNPRLDNLGRRLGFALSDDLVCALVPDPARPNQPGRDGSPTSQYLQINDLNPLHEVTRAMYRTGRFPTITMAREIQRAASVPEGVAVDLSLMRTGKWCWLEQRTVVTAGERTVDWFVPTDRPPEFAPRSVGAVIDVVTGEGKPPGHFVLLSGLTLMNGAFRTVNGDLGLNVFQWMAERKELVGVRGTRYVPKQLKLVGAQVERVQWLLVAGVPGALLLLGIVVLWRRSRI